MPVCLLSISRPGDKRIHGKELLRFRWWCWFRNSKGVGSAEDDRPPLRTCEGAVFVLILEEETEVLGWKKIIRLKPNSMNRVKWHGIRGYRGVEKAPIVADLPLVIAD